MGSAYQVFDPKPGVRAHHLAPQPDLIRGCPPSTGDGGACRSPVRTPNPSDFQFRLAKAGCRSLTAPSVSAEPSIIFVDPTLSLDHAAGRSKEVWRVPNGR
ncbi:hypothetical protein BHE74_00044758 [Ensete ventricosum]|nr:hypothetical protein GW17_00051800 [Ensete ventricosum]RWW49115.1 hypothetical protein BHE74_00044758 [Ensete ventricosum]